MAAQKGNKWWPWSSDSALVFRCGLCPISSSGSRWAATATRPHQPAFASRSSLPSLHGHAASLSHRQPHMATGQTSTPGHSGSVCAGSSNMSICVSILPPEQFSRPAFDGALVFWIIRRNPPEFRAPLVGIRLTGDPLRLSLDPQRASGLAVFLIPAVAVAAGGNVFSQRVSHDHSSHSY